jgi:hypothetical protein
VAITAFYTQRHFKMIHDHVKAIPGDILGQYLEIVVVLLLWGMGRKSGYAGGHYDNHQYG